MDRLNIIIENVPVGADDDRVQSEPFRYDGNFHIFPEHLIFPSHLPAVPAYDNLVRIMRQCLSFGNAVVGLKFLVGDGCGVRLVPVDVR